MSKISIIVLTWNSLSYVQQTLPQILKQKTEGVEIIYVDNGSSDGTVEYLLSQNVKVIQNKENLGISIAKNQGVKESHGEYLLLLDDDMLIEDTNFLTDITNYYQTLNNPAFLMPLFLDKEELQDGYTRSFGTYYYPFGIKKKVQKRNIQNIMQYQKPIEIAINQGGAMFIKKTIWNELGGFDESQKFNLDDDDISTRALVYGYNNYLYNKKYIVHMGLAKRMDKKRYAWNDKTYYSGKAKAIIKNFSILTNLYMFPLFSIRAFAEAVYHTLTLRHLPIFFASIESFITLLKDLPDTLRKREVIQKNRKRSDAYILKLRAPEYEH